MLKVWRNKEIAKKYEKPIKCAIYMRLSREEIEEKEKNFNEYNRHFRKERWQL